MMPRVLLWGVIVALGLGAATSSEALLRVERYSTTDALEAEFDGVFEHVQQALAEHAKGPLPFIDLEPLREFIEARHRDFLLFMWRGQPLSQDDVAWCVAVDRIVSKHDVMLLTMLRDHLARFEPRDREDAEAILQVLTRGYGGMIDIITGPPPTDPVAEATAQERQAYVWYQIHIAFYERQFDRARQLLESDEAQQLGDSAQRLLLLGALAYHAADYQQAVDYYEAALPQLPHARDGSPGGIRQGELAHTIARIHADQLQHIGQAGAYFTIALEDGRDDPALLNSYAWFLLEHQRDPRMARPFIERALAKDPDDPALLDTYGLLLLQEGKRAEAAIVFRHALTQEDLQPSTRAIVMDHWRQAE